MPEISARLVAICQIAGCNTVLTDDDADRTLLARGPGCSKPMKIHVCRAHEERFCPKKEEADHAE